MVKVENRFEGPVLSGVSIVVPPGEDAISIVILKGGKVRAYTESLLREGYTSLDGDPSILWRVCDRDTFKDDERRKL